MTQRQLVSSFSNQWRVLANSLGMPISVRENALNYLLQQYQEPHRHYHNLAHICSMLDGIEQHKELFAEPDTARLAAFFHDAVYDPQSRTNEEKSAVEMLGLLTLYANDRVLTKAASMIVATQGHRRGMDADCNLLLDLDFNVLGAPWPIYAKYADGIMKEYAPAFGEELYRQKRVEHFLEPMLAKSSVFVNPYFASREQAVRDNMNRECEILRAGKALVPPRAEITR